MEANTGEKDRQAPQNRKQAQASSRMQGNRQEERGEEGREEKKMGKGDKKRGVKAKEAPNHARERGEGVGDGERRLSPNTLTESGSQASGRVPTQSETGGGAEGTHGQRSRGDEEGAGGGGCAGEGGGDSGGGGGGGGDLRNLEAQKDDFLASAWEAARAKQREREAAREEQARIVREGLGQGAGERKRIQNDIQEIAAANGRRADEVGGVGGEANQEAREMDALLEKEQEMLQGLQEEMARAQVWVRRREEPRENDARGSARARAHTHTHTHTHNTPKGLEGGRGVEVVVGEREEGGEERRVGKELGWGGVCDYVCLAALVLVTGKRQQG